jgi:glutathione S-transferase
VSHFNEKVRWALAYKGVEHERRAPPPPAHMAVALALTRGRAKTFPILELNGETVADSTDIIAALEEGYPDPPLYPADPAERRRALELEDFFDEELGPQIRLLGWNLVTQDPERLKRLAVESAPGPLQAAPALAARTASLYLGLRYRVKDSTRAEAARVKVSDAMDRLEAELGDAEYLVGDSFSVADLTAASLFYPLVMPPGAPRQLADPTPAWAAIVDTYRGRRGFSWIGEMYARHRK